ncbi:amino acid adenylation domain-containing protein [Nostoc sp. ATCC 53789]|nr:amino acid adenylation domain-containing protein [Nostoc sp. ATCC 53789]
MGGWRTMSASQLLDDLTQNGVYLWAEGDKLRFRAPKGVLTEELRDRLTAHKLELLAILQTPISTAEFTLVHAPEERYQPFPLTDLQQAYALGGSNFFDLGNVSAHFYVEFAVTNLDIERLNLAWQRLIERHEMLRAVILPDAQQQILETVPPFAVEVIDLRGQKEAEQQIAAMRQQMKDNGPSLDKYPLFEVRVQLLNEERAQLHISISLLICDALSGGFVFQDLYQFYLNPQAQLPALNLSFRDYILTLNQRRQTAAYQKARDYWWPRLSEIPPAPELPLAKSPSAIEKPTFTRWQGQLAPAVWQQFKTRVSQLGLTPAAAICAAYATILTTWSKNQKLTVNILYFNREPLHPQVYQVLGNCSSTLLLTVDHTQSESFAAQAKRLQEQLWSDLEHTAVTGVEVLGELNRMQGGTARAAMPCTFASALGLGNRDTQTNAAGEQDWQVICNGLLQTPFVLLDHQIVEENGALLLNWDAVEEAFPSGLMAQMFDAYQLLLHRLAESDNTWQTTTEWLIPEAQLQQRAAVNATNTTIPTQLLHELFVEQATQHPQKLAIAASQLTLTYAELDRLSNYIGRQLRDLGARPNQLVAVVMEKGWEQLVAVLGILKSGAAYLPIDPSLPQERLSWLLDNAEVAIAFTQPQLEANLSFATQVKWLTIDDSTLVQASTKLPLPSIQTPEDLAYVIYTSGSTGTPKGVMIDHRGAANTILDINQRFGVTAEDRVFAISSLSFDLSVYDIFGTLAAGGTIIMPDAQGSRDPVHWLDVLQREQVTVWNSAPALMKLLVEYAGDRCDRLPSSLRLVMMSGDWIPVTLPEQIHSLGNNVQVISLGGATEASIWSIFYPIETIDPSWTSIPYGKPLSNQSFHILDEALQPRPDWVPGQIYIGGIGLAQGYWRDPAKTQASFIHHPRTGERLYRTGDLGRYLPDGNIEFLGRIDFQVKIRGYRIEIGEVETVLQQNPAIRSVAVSAVGKQRDEKQLVAYIVFEQEQSITSLELRSYLQQKLPEYMIPSMFMFMDSLPLSSNGKVDRRALPDPEQSQADLGAIVPPRDSLELQLVQIWQEILKLPEVGITNNFFELGGTSIQAVRLMTQIHKLFAQNLPLSTLFQGGTVEHLARTLRESSDSSVPWSPLVSIQPSGSQPPFFCVHPAGGNVLCYMDLSRRLGADQPFYGLQAVGMDGEQPPFTTIEDMAAYYIAAIRTVQPQGPYSIGGWSFGGIAALEIAQQLRQQGEEVNMLVLIDCPAPLSSEDLDEATLAAWFIQDLEGRFDVDATRLQQLQQLDTAQQLNYILEQARLLHLVPPDAGVEQVNYLFEVFKCNMRAIESYTPRSYEGLATLLRAENQPPENPTDPALDWHKLLTNLEVRWIPGNHYTMVREPDVQTLATQLRACLAVMNNWQPGRYN